MITEYMNELVCYGGIMTPRYEIIKDLKKRGMTRKQIDDYLFQLDQHNRRTHDVQNQKQISLY